MSGASASAIKAGAAYVSLSADNSALISGLKEAESRLKSWGKGIGLIGSLVGAAGAAIAAPFIEGLHVFSDMGAEMLNLSKRTGVSVEDLSALGFAASQSGVSVEELSHGLMHLQRDLAHAGQGGTEAAGKFAQLGISIQELQGLSPDKQLERVADSFAGMTDPAAKASAAMGLFGRGGVALLPLLEKGSAGIDELKQKASQLGVVMSGQAAQDAAAFKYQMDGLSQQFKAVAFNLGAAVVPMVREWISAVQPAIGAAIEWVKANQGLLAAVFKFGAILAGVGAAIGIVAGFLTVAGYAVGFLVSPLGAVIFGVTALGYALYKLGVLDDLPGKFEETTKAIGPFTDAIKNAINAGDIGAAWDVAMAGIKVGFVELVQFLIQGWVSFNTTLDMLAIDMVAGFLKAWEDIKLGAKLMWLDVTRQGQAAKDAATRDTLGRESAIDQVAEKAKVSKALENQKDPNLVIANAALEQAKKELEAARAHAAGLVPKDLDKRLPRDPGSLGLGIGEVHTIIGGGNARGLGFGQSIGQQLVDETKRAADAAEKIAEQGGGIGVA